MYIWRAEIKNREGESEGAQKNLPVNFKKIKARALLRAVEKNTLCFFLQNEGKKKINIKIIDLINNNLPSSSDKTSQYPSIPHPAPYFFVLVPSWRTQ